MKRVPTQHDALALWSVVRRWMLRHRPASREDTLRDVPALQDLVDAVGEVMGYWTPEDGEEPLAVPGPPPPPDAGGEPVSAVWRPGPGTHVVRILPPHGKTFQASAQTIAPRARQGKLPFEPDD